MSTESKEDEKAPQKHATLAAALVAAQREARGGPPADGFYDATGKQSGKSVAYNYPKPETSIPWLKSVLNRHGLAFAPGAAFGCDKTPPPVVVSPEVVMIPLQYTIAHDGTGERQSWTAWAPVCLPYGGTMMKGWKNTQTGCLKYQLLDALNCRTEADDDEGAVPTAAGRRAEEGPPPPIIGAPAPQAAPAPPPVPGGAAPRPLPPAASQAAAPPPAAAPAPTAPAPQPPPSAATPFPAPAPGAAASTPAAPSTARPDAAPFSADDLAAAEHEHRRARAEKLMAAVRATGLPGAAVSQYIVESVLPGVALSDPADLSPAESEKILAALAALRSRPLPEADVAALALRRAKFLEEAERDAVERDRAGAPSAAEERAAVPPVPQPTAAPAAPPAAPPATPGPAGRPPAPPAIPGSAATDQRLAGRFASFMKRASDHRKATGVPNADEAYLNRINSWARVPGLTSFARPIGETERAVTAPVMDLLEAGLAGWIAETAPVGAGK